MIAGDIAELEQAAAGIIREIADADMVVHGRECCGPGEPHPDCAGLPE